MPVVTVNWLEGRSLEQKKGAGLGDYAPRASRRRLASGADHGRRS